MLCVNDQTFAAIEEGLARVTVDARQVAADRWEVSLGKGQLPMTVRWQPDWLLLAAPLKRLLARKKRPGDQLVNELRVNAVLPHCVKLSIDAKRLFLTSQLPFDIEEETNPADKIEAACRRLQLGLAAWSGRKGTACLSVSDQSSEAIIRDDSSEDVNRQLADLVTAVGWPYHQRDAELRVELEVPAAFCQASFAQRGDGSVGLWFDMRSSRPDSPASLNATALLLLTASHCVRLVRPSAVTEDDDLVCRWEITWDEPPDESELAQALPALSVAHRLTFHEVAALENETLARQYLAIRGWSI